MSNPLDFGGKVVLVTGGGKGIGGGIAEAFLAAGAQVIVCGRSQPDTLPSCAGREALDEFWPGLGRSSLRAACERARTQSQRDHQPRRSRAAVPPAGDRP